MKFGNEWESRVGNALMAFFFLLLTVGAFYSIEPERWFNGEYSLFFLVVCWILIIYQKYEMPAGEMTEEGIYVRHFLIKRFYAWKDIRQAGLLERNFRGKYYELILVKPKGSPRKVGDSGFLLKNLFHVIHIPYSEAKLHYIASHYGPLDFDQRYL